MDKRTKEGKIFKELPTNEKPIFLLEKIYDRLEYIPKLEYKLNNMERVLKFIAQRELEQQEILNHELHWNEDYIKKLKEKLKYL